MSMFEKFFKQKEKSKEENPALRIVKEIEEAVKKEKLEAEEGKRLPAEEEKNLLVKAAAEEGVARALYKFEKSRQKKSTEAEDKL